MERHKTLGEVVVSAGIAIAAGCSEDSNACQGLSSVTVEVGNHELVMFRNGSGEWQSPIALGSDRYQLCVQQDYVVLAACEDPQTRRFKVVQRAATALDEQSFSLGSCPAEGDVETANLSGEVLQPGTIFAGLMAPSSGTAPWSFNIDIPVGLHDLVASDLQFLGGGGSKILIRRDILLSANRVEPAIDLAQGTDLESVTMQLEGQAADDELTTEVDLFTSHGFARISEINGTVARIAPQSILEEGDEQVAVLRARAGESSREVRTRKTLDSTFMLLPRITDEIVYNDGPSGIAATWSALPNVVFDSVELSVRSVQLDTITLQATQRWLDATGGMGLELDMSVPGFDGRWVIAESEAVDTFFSIRRDLGETQLATEQHRTLTPPP